MSKTGAHDQITHVRLMLHAPPARTFLSRRRRLARYYTKKAAFLPYSWKTMLSINLLIASQLIFTRRGPPARRPPMLCHDGFVLVNIDSLSACGHQKLESAQVLPDVRFDPYKALVLFRRGRPIVPSKSRHGPSRVTRRHSYSPLTRSRSFRA